MGGFAFLILLAFVLAGCSSEATQAEQPCSVDAGKCPAQQPCDAALTPDQKPPVGCPGLAGLLVSPAVEDQANSSLPGSAAALLATVPTGCSAILQFAQAGPYVLKGTLVFPAWTTLRFADGAFLSVSSGALVTVQGRIEAKPLKIFGGEGEIKGPPLIDAAYPEWFGAVPGDEQDDHGGIQRALDFYPIVEFQAGVYDVASTVLLRSGVHLRGPVSTPPTATLRSKLIFPGNGFYPTRMLEAKEGTSELGLSYLALDGNRSSKQGVKACQSCILADNLARFEGVTGLRLEHCLLTGYEANWGSADSTLFHVLAVVNSQDIEFDYVSFTDSRIEGILFKNSKQVVVDHLETQNSDIWTPLHAWYVVDFTLTNSIFREDEGNEQGSGSTVNLAVQEALVADNQFLGGGGLDFGNELGDPFEPRDIAIERNTIQTTKNGIYFSDIGDKVVSRVLILGNTIEVQWKDGDVTDDDNKSEIIRFDAVKDLVIEENSLTHLLNNNVKIGRGVSFAAATQGVTIRTNSMTGVDTAVSFTGNADHQGGIVVYDNKITCSTFDRLNSWSGSRTGVYLRRRSTSTAMHFDSVLVENNEISALGGWVTLIDEVTVAGTPVLVDFLGVTKNTFSPEGGSERNVFVGDDAAALQVTGNAPAWVNQ